MEEYDGILDDERSHENRTSGLQNYPELSNMWMERSTMANPKVVKLRQRLRERGRLEDQPCGLSVFFHGDLGTADLGHFRV